MRKRSALAALVAAMTVLVAACGGGGTTTGGETGGATKTVRVGFIAPLTGSLAALGTGMRNAAQLQIDQANKAGRIKGWRIAFEPLDDTGTGTQAGSAAAQKLASEPDVVAVVGTLNSSIAQAAQPILNSARIAMVSPANTNSGLTMGPNWETAPKRVFDNFFRVVTHDGLQGPFGARYAYDKLGKRKAVTIHDKKAYGQGLVASFTKGFKEKGGQIVDALEVNPGEGDYKAGVTRAKGKSPDFIYYGGEYPEAGIIAKNMSELGMKAPQVIVMGGDGMVNADFVKRAGDGAQGHYATLVGASADVAPNAKKFVTDYDAAQFKEPMSAFGPPAYDAAGIVVAALAEVLPGKTKIDSSVREAVIKAIQEISYNGVLGTTTFDQFGDTTNKLLTVMKVEGDDFKPVESQKF
jgi:branched-chain amino acid transport system substrate-binding protein